MSAEPRPRNLRAYIKSFGQKDLELREAYSQAKITRDEAIQQAVIELELNEQKLARAQHMAGEFPAIVKDIAPLQAKVLDAQQNLRTLRETAEPMPPPPLAPSIQKVDNWLSQSEDTCDPDILEVHSLEDFESAIQLSPDPGELEWEYEHRKHFLTKPIPQSVELSCQGTKIGTVGVVNAGRRVWATFVPKSLRWLHNLPPAAPSTGLTQPSSRVSTKPIALYLGDASAPILLPSFWGGLSDAGFRSFFHVFKSESESTRGSVDLSHSFDQMPVLNFVKSWIIHNTVDCDESDFISHDQSRIHDDVERDLRPHLEKFIRAPWSDQICGQVAMLKLLLEQNHRDIRFFDKQYKGYYGARIRTRDHSWLLAEFFVQSSIAETATTPQIQVAKSSQYNAFVGRCGKLSFFVAERP